MTIAGNQRPAVLLVEPDVLRRRALTEGLARARYEVVPTVSAEEGKRFAWGLESALIIAPFGLADESFTEAVDARPNSPSRTLLLLGDQEEEPTDLADHIFFLSIQDLDDEAILERLMLLLLSREVGLETDISQGVLVGNLGERALLGLIRDLGALTLDLALEIEGGELLMVGGEIAYARVGKAEGIKAFCRLTRVRDGLVRIRLLSVRPEVDEIETSLDELIITAIEDSLGEIPPRDHLLRIDRGIEALDQTLNPLAQHILRAAEQSRGLEAILDSLPDRDGEIVQEILELQHMGAVRLEAPSRSTIVVTDSTCDLPPTVRRLENLQIVPLHVDFEAESFLDRVSLSSKDFYAKLQSAAKPPTTRPPEVQRFKKVFERVLPESDMLAIFLSSALSETHRNARQSLSQIDSEAKAGWERTPVIEVIDSGQVGAALGLLALFAARLCHRGIGVTEAASRLRDIRDRIQSLIAVESLDSLRRSGRVSRARAWVGGLLGIRPILAIENGEIVPIDKVRGGRGLHARLIEHFEQRADPSKPTIITVTHAMAPLWADRLRTLLEERFDVQEVLMSEIGPVVGTHVGPGTVAAAVFQPTPEEIALLAPLDQDA